MTVSKKEGIWEGLLEDSIRHHRPPAIMALTNLVRLVMWRNLKKHVEDEVVLPPLTVANETVTSSSAESVLYAHRYHEMRGMLERELRARKARGEFAARDDVDEAAAAGAPPISKLRSIVTSASTTASVSKYSTLDASRST